MRYAVAARTSMQFENSSVAVACQAERRTMWRIEARLHTYLHGEMCHLAICTSLQGTRTLESGPLHSSASSGVKRLVAAVKLYASTVGTIFTQTRCHIIGSINIFPVRAQAVWRSCGARRLDPIVRPAAAMQYCQERTAPHSTPISPPGLPVPPNRRHTLRITAD